MGRYIWLQIKQNWLNGISKIHSPLSIHLIRKIILQPTSVCWWSRGGWTICNIFISNNLSMNHASQFILPRKFPLHANLIVIVRTLWQSSLHAIVIIAKINLVVKSILMYLNGLPTVRSFLRQNK